MANRTFVLQLAGAQMQTAGLIFKMQDPDNVGRDDVIGKVLESGGKAVLSYSQGNIKSVDEHLKAVADGIYDYLGITPPESSG